LDPRSDSRLTIGGLNTSGTVTYTSEFTCSSSGENSAVDYVAAGGGTVEITASREMGQMGVFVNRPNGPSAYGGTVVLSGSAWAEDVNGDPIPAPGYTALEAGTLQISDLNQIGTGHFEFNASSGDSGTLRYTGGSATTTRNLWIDNSGITRAAIDVTNGGTVLTWNPSDGNINQNFTKAGAGALVLGEQVTGGTVNVEAGLLILTQTNSYSGGTVVSGGAVEISGGYGSPGGSAAGLGTGSVSIPSGGQVTYWLSYSNSHTIANSFSLAGGNLHTNDGINTFSGLVTLAAGTSTISGKYEDPITLSGGLAGSGHVIFTQSGGTGGWAAPAFILSGTGSSTGTVRVSGASDFGATKLQLANVNALQSATLDMASGDAGTVEFTVAGNNTYSLGGLQGSRSLPFGGNSLSVGSNGQSTTYSGVLSGGGGFTKVGSGNLILAGTSTYTGTTTVSAGRLSVNGSLGSSPVAVLAASELGGSGFVGGSVSVASGGTLAPGNSIASFATGTATFAAGATFAYEVDSTNPLSLGSAADLLVVSGNLNLDTGNGTILTLADLAGSPSPFVDNTTIFALINYSGTWNGGLFTYGGTPLADGGTFTAGSQQWVIDYNRASATGLANFTGDYLPSSSFVTITAVPEPSTCAMALAGLACGGYSMFRRRKRA
jgi:autotransporter-associated beta strand protein